MSAHVPQYWPEYCPKCARELEWPDGVRGKVCVACGLLVRFNADRHAFVWERDRVPHVAADAGA